MLKQLSDSTPIIRIQTWDLAAPVPPALQQALATDWPTTVGSVTTVGTSATGLDAPPHRTDSASRAGGIAAILCVGPTEWLVLGGDSEPAAPLVSLQTALQATSYRATHVTDALARIEIEGPEARLLLAKGCSLASCHRQSSTRQYAGTLDAPAITRALITCVHSRSIQ